METIWKVTDMLNLRMRHPEQLFVRICENHSSSVARIFSVENSLESEKCNLLPFHRQEWR